MLWRVGAVGAGFSAVAVLFHALWVDLREDEAGDLGAGEVDLADGFGCRSAGCPAAPRAPSAAQGNTHRLCATPSPRVQAAGRPYLFPITHQRKNSGQAIPLEWPRKPYPQAKRLLKTQKQQNETRLLRAARRDRRVDTETARFRLIPWSGGQITLDSVQNRPDKWHENRVRSGARHWTRVLRCGQWQKKK